MTNIKINIYPIDEIILEKYRAILTRDSLKEQDVLGVSDDDISLLTSIEIDDKDYEEFKKSAL